MGMYVAQILSLINRYRLDQRERAAAQLRALAELGRLSEASARGYLPRVWYWAERERDRPNFLHRPPDASEIAADGKPDIELGTLVEADLPFGIRLLDRPRHVLVAGAAGSGKTTAIRKIIEGIDGLHQ